MNLLCKTARLISGESGTGIYAIFDNHQDAQGKLKAIKSELPSDNIIELDKEFEECFSDEILTEAVSKLFSEFTSKLNDDERNDILQKLSSRSKSASRVLIQYYFEKTGYVFSKVDFGKALACVIDEWDEGMKSKPEYLLDKIRKDIDSRLKITG